jgi:hypothetical protein
MGGPIPNPFASKPSAPTPAPVADDLPWKDEDDSATSKATEKKLGAKKAKTSEKFDA